ncbi:hypothetical protein GQR58_003741 [Nymphon striatum]|nr:hypothetical protein GQR58_003741 [Nymphon striatum]
MEERAVIRDLCFAEQLGQKEKIDAVSHEWIKYLSSIFIPDVLHPAGFAMRKGNKSDYGTMLKTTMALQWNEPEELPASDMKTSYFIDLMAFIQRYQDLGSVTFQELSRIYLQKILSIIPQHCDIVHVVGDRQNPSLHTITHDNLRLPQWKGFLASLKNKQHLEEYLCEAWTTHPEWIPHRCTLILGGMTLGPAKLLSSVGVSDNELWMQKQGTFIPCHWISQFLSSCYSNSTTPTIRLAYALTGCDSVSYIFNCGKKRALKVALECDKILRPFAEYGMPELSIEMSEAIHESVCKYMCALYGKRDFSRTLDQLRCHLFRTKMSDIRSLPPTCDAFRLHLMRALYQLVIWKRATSPTLSLPPPTEFSWSTKKGFLLAIQMTKLPKLRTVSTFIIFTESRKPLKELELTILKILCVSVGYKYTEKELLERNDFVMTDSTSCNLTVMDNVCMKFEADTTITDLH